MEPKVSIRILYSSIKDNRIDYKSTKKSVAAMSLHLNSMTRFNHSYIMTNCLLLLTITMKVLKCIAARAMKRLGKSEMLIRSNTPYIRTDGGSCLLTSLPQLLPV